MRYRSKHPYVCICRSCSLFSHFFYYRISCALARAHADTHSCTMIITYSVNFHAINISITRLIALSNLAAGCPGGYFCPPGSPLPLNCSAGAVCPPLSASETPCPPSYICPPGECGSDVPCRMLCALGITFAIGAVEDRGPHLSSEVSIWLDTNITPRECAN